MQPYVNPNYFNQYPQYQQPYQPDLYTQRLNGLQQFQQSLQQPAQNTSMLAPIGKIVESIDIVKATDIPMDGNTYYFPKADGTEIYSKQWLPNGQTRILAFKPILEENPSSSSNENENGDYKAIKEFYEGIQTELQTLNEKIDKISKTTTAKKKEVATDEQ